jgi:hypothetical protein
MMKTATDKLVTIATAFLGTHATAQQVRIALAKAREVLEFNMPVSTAVLIEAYWIVSARKGIVVLNPKQAH